jgi:thymidylate synthase ThyX
LTPILGRKRAKESARYFKTYNSQIQSDVMFNMRSFANFLKLRKSEHAQKEINEIASNMLELVRQTGKFEHTLNAWGYDRIKDNGDMI